MRTLRQGLLAGIAAVAAGFSGPALAETQMHVMTVQLPGGGVAQIRYTGNVAPRITFGAAPAPLDLLAPMPALFGRDSPFAVLERVSADMDRQAAAMFRQAEALASAAQSGRLTTAALASLPPGSASYTFVSTMSGNGTCSESVQIATEGNGAPPRVLRRSSGNCGPISGGGTLPTMTPLVDRGGPVWTSAPAARPAAPGRRPDVVWTAAHGARPYAGRVEPIPAAQPQP